MSISFKDLVLDVADDCDGRNNNNINNLSSSSSRPSSEWQALETPVYQLDDIYNWAPPTPIAYRPSSPLWSIALNLQPVVNDSNETTFADSNETTFADSNETTFADSNQMHDDFAAPRKPAVKPVEFAAPLKPAVKPVEFAFEKKKKQQSKQPNKKRFPWTPADLPSNPSDKKNLKLARLPLRPAKKPANLPLRFVDLPLKADKKKPASLPFNINDNKDLSRAKQMAEARNKLKSFKIPKKKKEQSEFSEFGENDIVVLHPDPLDYKYVYDLTDREYIKFLKIYGKRYLLSKRKTTSLTFC